MTPETILIETNTSENYEIIPSLTYKLDFVNKRIIGKIDDNEAIIQAIKKIFMTDKYAYVIYNWYYGNEISDLIGTPYDYTVARFPQVIEDALLVDDRVTKITNYEFSKVSVDSVEVSFLIHTIYGELPYSLEVQI